MCFYTLCVSRARLYRDSDSGTSSRLASKTGKMQPYVTYISCFVMEAFHAYQLVKMKGIVKSLSRFYFRFSEYVHMKWFWCLRTALLNPRVSLLLPTCFSQFPIKVFKAFSVKLRGAVSCCQVWCFRENFIQKSLWFLISHGSVDCQFTRMSFSILFSSAPFSCRLIIHEVLIDFAVRQVPLWCNLSSVL